MKNITLSMDKEMLRRGRDYARRHNISFNALVRRLVEQAVCEDSTQWIDETFSLMDDAKASSGGKKWSRDELHRD